MGMLLFAFFRAPSPMNCTLLLTGRPFYWQMHSSYWFWFPCTAHNHISHHLPSPPYHRPDLQWCSASQRLTRSSFFPTTGTMPRDMGAHFHASAIFRCRHMFMKMLFWGDDPKCLQNILRTPCNGLCDVAAALCQINTTPPRGTWGGRDSFGFPEPHLFSVQGQWFEL